MKKLSALLRPDKSIHYLDPLTTGPGISAPLVEYADLPALQAANPNNDWFVLLDNPTMAVYWIQAAAGAGASHSIEYTLPLSRMTLNPYVAGVNNETRVIVLGQQADIDFEEKLAFIRLPDISDAVAQTIPEDFRYEVDSGFSKGSMVIGILTSTAKRDLWTSSTFGTNGNILANRTHFQYEAYMNSREVGTRTDLRWVGVNYHALLLAYGDSKDGWGNDAELNSKGFFSRYSLNDIEYFDLVSKIGVTSILGNNSTVGGIGGGSNSIPLMNQTVVVPAGTNTNYFFASYLGGDFVPGARVRFICEMEFVLRLQPSANIIVEYPRNQLGDFTGDWSGFNAAVLLSVAGVNQITNGDGVVEYFFKSYSDSNYDTYEFISRGSNLWSYMPMDFGSWSNGMIPWGKVSKVGATYFDANNYPLLRTQIFDLNNMVLADIGAARLLGCNSTEGQNLAVSDLVLHNANNMRGARKPLFIENDFLNGTAAAGCVPWTPSAIGTTGTLTNVTTADAEMIGAVRMSSIATANTGYILTTQIASQLLDGDEKFECVFRLPANLSATSAVRMGFMNAGANTTEPTNGVFGYITGATNVLTPRVRNNSVNTDSATYALTANTWYRLEIEILSTTSTVFTLYDRSGNVLHTVTNAGAIPSVTGREVGNGALAYNTAATAANLLDVCYMSMLNGRNGMNR